MPIRPTSSDPTTQLRLPGPTAAPGEPYWRKLELEATGYVARTVQVDEPSLARALDENEAASLRSAYRRLRALLPDTRLVLTAEPGAFSRESVPLAVRLPVDALYLDIVARPRLLAEALALAPAGLGLVLPEGAR
ncbi:MAG: hypothetical protein QM729_05330 [Solirubrobacterales bacterium]